MAYLYITELKDIAIGHNGNPMPTVGKMPPVAEQQVGISGSSAASAAFNSATRFVILSSDVTCSVTFSPTPGATPTAVTTSYRLAAGVPVMFGVNPGDKVAAITNS